MTRPLPAVLLLLALPFSASAAPPDGEALMEAEYCFPLAGLKKQLSQFDGLKPAKRDRVGPVSEIAFTLEAGEAPPQALALRDAGAATPLSLRRKDRPGDEVWVSANLVPLLPGVSDAAEICMTDPAREGRPFSERGYGINVGFNIRWLDRPGTHTLDDLEDGLKDGRSHWKKMVGAMGFMVPKFDHVAVAGDDRDNPPAVHALRGGEDLGPVQGEYYDGARMVPMDALDALDADAIRVMAQTYRMTPSPDAATVARFAGG